MAKLTGVKTIDMVNGELTKISYEGAEYAKTYEAAVGGDLLLRIAEDLPFAKVGSYFRATEEQFPGRTRYVYNDGDACRADPENFAVFRKVNASQSPGSTLTAKVDELDSRVTALEKGGDKPVYKTKKRAAKVGERILITKKRGFTMKDMTVGNTYEVVELGDNPSYVEVYDDKGDQASALSEGYEVIVEDKPTKPQPAQSITHDGAVYTLVDRKAQAGDVVIPTGKSTSSFVRKDTPYLVDNRLKVEGFTVYKDGYNRTEANVLVYEKKEPALKEGDYAVIIGDASNVNVGDVVELRESGCIYDFRTFRVSDEMEEPMDARHMRKATDAEVAEALKPKTGDIAVITANTNNSRNKVGDIGKVGGKSPFSSSLAVFVPGGPEMHVYTRLDEMHIATEDERAQYEKAVAMSKYKTGDYVVITKSEKGHEGKVAEVVDLPTNGTDFAIKIINDTANYYGAYVDQIRKATESEIADAKKPKLKVGDYARVKDGAESRHGDIAAGNIVKVTDTDYAYPYKVRVDLLDGSDYDRFKFDDLELVDEKVVTFAKIRRKPGEFKKGDIVRAKWTVEGAKAGKLFEIKRGPIGDLDGGNYEFVGGDGTLGKDIELVTPVESRVDNVA